MPRIHTVPAPRATLLCPIAVPGPWKSQNAALLDRCLRDQPLHDPGWTIHRPRPTAAQRVLIHSLSAFRKVMFSVRRSAPGSSGVPRCQVS